MTKKISNYEADLGILLDELEVIETETAIVESSLNLSDEVAKDMSPYEYFLRMKELRRKMLLLNIALRKSVATVERLHDDSQKREYVGE